MYVREAHPQGEPTRSGRPAQVVPGGGGVGALPLAGTLEQRLEGAALASEMLGLTMTVVADGMDDAVNYAYGAWPDRLYLVGQDGLIRFAGQPGPRGFDPAALEAALRLLPAPEPSSAAAGPVVISGPSDGTEPKVIELPPRADE